MASSSTLTKLTTPHNMNNLCHSLTLELKMEVIRQMENVCRTMNLPPSTVTTIMNNADKIKQSNQQQPTEVNANNNVVKFSTRNRLIEKMEKLLTIWIENMKDKKEICVLTKLNISNKAVSIFEKLKAKEGNGNEERFLATTSWFTNYWNRTKPKMLNENSNNRCNDVNQRKTKKTKTDYSSTSSSQHDSLSQPTVAKFKKKTTEQFKNQNLENKAQIISTQTAPSQTQALASPVQIPVASSKPVEKPRPREKEMFVINGHQRCVMSSLSSLWKSGKFCDAGISNGKYTVKVHKVVLCAVCPKLFSVFSMKSLSEKFLEVNLPEEVSTNALNAFANYMYDGVLDLDPDILEQLKIIAKRLYMHEFEQVCDSHLPNHIPKPPTATTSFSNIPGIETKPISTMASSVGSTISTSVQTAPITTQVIDVKPENLDVELAQIQKDTAAISGQESEVVPQAPNKSGSTADFDTCPSIKIEPVGPQDDKYGQPKMLNENSNNRCNDVNQRKAPKTKNYYLSVSSSQDDSSSQPTVAKFKKQTTEQFKNQNLENKAQIISTQPTPSQVQGLASQIQVAVPKPKPVEKPRPREKQVFVISDYQHCVMANLSSLWKCEKLCDAGIGNRKSTVKVHRVVLCAVCPKLLSVFSIKSLSDKFLEVNLPEEVNTEALNAFAEYMYDGVLDLDPDILEQLKIIAKRLYMNEFEQLCDSHLPNHIPQPAAAPFTNFPMIQTTTPISAMSSSLGSTISTSVQSAPSITTQVIDVKQENFDVELAQIQKDTAAIFGQESEVVSLAPNKSENSGGFVICPSIKIEPVGPEDDKYGQVSNSSSNQVFASTTSLSLSSLATAAAASAPISSVSKSFAKYPIPSSQSTDIKSTTVKRSHCYEAPLVSNLTPEPIIVQRMHSQTNCINKDPSKIPSPTSNSLSSVTDFATSSNNTVYPVRLFTARGDNLPLMKTHITDATTVNSPPD